MNRVRRIGMAVAATALATSGIVAAAPAAVADKVPSCTTYAAKETLSIRSQPSTKGKVLGTLAKGKTVCGFKVNGGSYTACGKRSSSWIRFGVKINEYVAATCMKPGKTPPGALLDNHVTLTPQGDSYGTVVPLGGVA
ncbi:SH3 domain-containing protein [Streptomyces sp. S6]